MPRLRAIPAAPDLLHTDSAPGPRATERTSGFLRVDAAPLVREERRPILEIVEDEPWSTGERVETAALLPPSLAPATLLPLGVSASSAALAFAPPRASGARRVIAELVAVLVAVAALSSGLSVVTAIVAVLFFR